MKYSTKLKTIVLTVNEDHKTGNQVKTANTLIDICRSIYKDLDADQEHFSILFLNNSLKVEGFKTLFSGGMNSSNLDMRVIFRNALLFGATSIALCHNHPSGDTEPSYQDREATKRIKDAGKLLDITVIDHIILGSNAYSFQENGIL